MLVVERDKTTIRAAEVLVDLGPGAGVRDGRVVAMGTPDEVGACFRVFSRPDLSEVPLPTSDLIST